MLYPRSGCTTRVPVYVPLPLVEFDFAHVPGLNAIALPIPPIVSPVVSVAFDGM